MTAFMRNVDVNADTDACWEGARHSRDGKGLPGGQFGLRPGLVWLKMSMRRRIGLLSTTRRSSSNVKSQGGKVRREYFDRAPPDRELRFRCNFPRSPSPSPGSTAKALKSSCGHLL